MNDPSNLWDLVQAAARRHDVSPDDLLEFAVKAVLDNVLKADFSPLGNPPPGMTWRGWLTGFYQSLIFGSEYRWARRFLRNVVVSKDEFEAWLPPMEKLVIDAPAAEASCADFADASFAGSDRQYFPEILAMRKSGEARSAYGAALALIDKGRIPLNNAERESVAKRVSDRYREDARVAGRSG